MRASQLVNENNSKLASHYTDVLNSRYTPYHIPLKITSHFVDQISNPRNKEPISMAEVADFFSKLLLKRHKFLRNLPEGVAIHVVDLDTDITVPIAKIDNVLVVKTIMRGEMRRGNQQRIAI